MDGIDQDAEKGIKAKELHACVHEERKEKVPAFHEPSF
jgi:hypothetical protein